MTLQALHKLAKGLQGVAQADPLRFWSPTPVQQRYLQDDSKIKLLRGGNQIGKSVCGAYEAISYCLQRHPYLQTPPPPLEVWVVCHSWEQSRVLQKKIYDLIPPASLHADVEFTTGKGFRGTGAPVVRFNNGSIMRIKTTNQGTLGLASGTVDYVWCDEPPPPDILGELLGRIVRTNGKMGITMTPIGIPCDHIKDLVEKGTITDHPAPLNLENVTPVGTGVPLLSQASIDQVAQSYLPIDREARMNGSWEAGVPDGRIFEQFKEELISDVAQHKGSDWVFAIGIDHGSQVNAEVAILVAVDVSDMKKGGKPFVYVLDEYTAGGASAEVHARGIISMVRRNRLELKQIRYWIGDRSHGGDKYGGRMSNNMLTAAMTHVLGYPRGRLPFAIRMAHKPAYSVYYGCQALHELMALSRFQIHPKCDRTIKSLKMWSMTKSGRMDVMSEWKHLIDALRYATMPIIDQQYRAPKMAKFSLGGQS